MYMCTKMLAKIYSMYMYEKFYFCFLLIEPILLKDLPTIRRLRESLVYFISFTSTLLTPALCFSAVPKRQLDLYVNISILHYLLFLSEISV